MAILLAFALRDGSRNIVALLCMSTILCAVVATMRLELPFPTEFNHWDERRPDKDDFAELLRRRG
jgi:hypothetical protein